MREAVHFLRIYFRALVFVCGVLLPLTASSTTGSSEVNELLDQAEFLMRMGVVDKGASRAFEESGELLEKAADHSKEVDLTSAESRSISTQLNALQEDLSILTELYEERFYGIFPLVRLLSSTPLEDEGFAFTEQTDHPPDLAAVEIATRKFLKLLDKYRHPHIVITSLPADRNLENVASELLIRDGRSTPLSRRALVATLSEEDVDALDRGEIDSQLVDRIIAAFDAANLIMLTVGQPVVLDNVSVRSLRGDYFTHAKSNRIESFEQFGFALDRRDQLSTIKIVSLAMFVLALFWSAFVAWIPAKNMKLFPRLIIGAGFFIFGRVFITVAFTFLRKIIPDSSAMIAAAWWWP
ncbi:MAG: hypothetical protein QNL05_11615, partial [Gammaproteobacteria bacterium]|nr:hypothetical protein [Gammaproteobacteria bacterium]MDX2488187.1 hypothetical protein [Gammaproteobacteria bacterium]